MKSVFKLCLKQGFLKSARVVQNGAIGTFDIGFSRCADGWRLSHVFCLINTRPEITKAYVAIKYLVMNIEMLLSL